MISANGHSRAHWYTVCQSRSLNQTVISEPRETILQRRRPVHSRCAAVDSRTELCGAAAKEADQVFSSDHNLQAPSLRRERSLGFSSTRRSHRGTQPPSSLWVCKSDHRESSSGSIAFSFVTERLGSLAGPAARGAGRQTTLQRDPSAVRPTSSSGPPRGFAAPGTALPAVSLPKR